MHFALSVVVEYLVALVPGYIFTYALFPRKGQMEGPLIFASALFVGMPKSEIETDSARVPECVIPKSYR